MKNINLSFIVGITVIVLITVGVTLYTGADWGRWGSLRGLDEARALLKNLPMQIGDWVAEKEGELDSTSITMLRIQDSYVFRSYKNTDTQAFVRVTFMVGPAGRITVHSPEVCFGGKDYKMESARERVEFNVLPLSSDKETIDTFWKVNYVGQSLDTNNLISFYYAVSPGDAWKAVEHPRLTFQKYRYVYKLQAEAFSGTEEAEDTVKKFLSECLPTFHEYLRPCE